MRSLSMTQQPIHSDTPFLLASHWHSSHLPISSSASREYNVGTSQREVERHVRQPHETSEKVSNWNNNNFYTHLFANTGQDNQKGHVECQENHAKGDGRDIDRDGSSIGAVVKRRTAIVTKCVEPASHFSSFLTAAFDGFGFLFSVWSGTCWNFFFKQVMASSIHTCQPVINKKNNRNLIKDSLKNPPLLPFNTVDWKCYRQDIIEYN